MCLKTQNEKATLNVSLRVFGREFREGPLHKCFVIYSANLTVSLQLRYTQHTLKKLCYVTSTLYFITRKARAWFYCNSFNNNPGMTAVHDDVSRVTPRFTSNRRK